MHGLAIIDVMCVSGRLAGGWRPREAGSERIGARPRVHSVWCATTATPAALRYSSDGPREEPLGRPPRVERRLERQVCTHNYYSPMYETRVFSKLNVRFDEQSFHRYSATTKNTYRESVLLTRKWCKICLTVTCDYRECNSLFKWTKIHKQRNQKSNDQETPLQICYEEDPEP